MAASTCEGATLPDEQAAPDDTATPSRSKPISRVSAFAPGIATSVVLGMRSASAPKMTVCGVAREPGFEPPAQRRHVPRFGSQIRLHGGGGSAETRDGGDVLGAGARAPLLPAAADQRLELECDSSRRISAPAPLGPPILCALKRHQVGAERPDVERDPARRLHGVDMQHAPWRCTISAACATGWITPVSLFASHQRDEDARSQSIQAPFERREIHHPARIDRNPLDLRGIEPPAA